jgi:hypothetical protein
MLRDDVNKIAQRHASGRRLSTEEIDELIQLSRKYLDVIIDDWSPRPTIRR